MLIHVRRRRSGGQTTREESAGIRERASANRGGHQRERPERDQRETREEALETERGSGNNGMHWQELYENKHFIINNV